MVVSTKFFGAKVAVSTKCFYRFISREQFERRTHKRLIDITKSTPKTVEALMALELPAGVEIEIKL